MIQEIHYEHCSSQSVEVSHEPRDREVLRGMEATEPDSVEASHEEFCQWGLGQGLAFLEEAQRNFEHARKSGRYSKGHDHLVGVILSLIEYAKQMHRFRDMDSRELALAHDTIESLKAEINRLDEARERLLEKSGGVDL